MLEHGGLEEIIASRKAPGTRRFEPRFVENLTPEPTWCEDEGQFKALQKAAGATHIGDDGQAEIGERLRDRASDRRKEATERSKNS